MRWRALNFGVFPLSLPFARAIAIPSRARRERVADRPRVRDRPREPVELWDHQCVALADRGERLLKPGPPITMRRQCGRDPVCR